jgi:hypothetical protein
MKDKLLIPALHLDARVESSSGIFVARQQTGEHTHRGGGEAKGKQR